MMTLQQLVEHFNDNFQQEHECDFRPLFLNKNKVIGIFGIAHISSQFTPIHISANRDLIAGYAAKAVVSNDENQKVSYEKINKFLTKTLNKPVHVRSIVSFDRLCRTVNLLNYLALANNYNFLITDVSPRHILSIPYNHGAYFEEIIVYSGLRTQNIVISMTIVGAHQEHYPQLLQGLNNYRECGYQIAINIGHLISADKTIAFINQLAPDYVIVTAPNEHYSSLNINSSLITALRNLKELTASVEGKIILQDVKHIEQSSCATQLGFDLVQGSYYEKLPDFKLGLVTHKCEVKNYSYSI